MKWTSFLLCLAALPSDAASFRIRHAAAAAPARGTGRGNAPPRLPRPSSLLPTASRGASASPSSSSTGLAMAPLLTHLRGGASVVATSLRTSLASPGPVGIAALAALTVSVVTPLALYRQAYSFSVGYAGSVAAAGFALSRSFDPSPGGPASALAGALAFYGVRLAGHLLWREFAVASKRESLRTFDKTPRLKRIPLCASVGLFYAFLCVPALYLCRMEGALSGSALAISEFFAGWAWIWAAAEAWADLHKFLAKRGRDGAAEFSGPTTWWYAISRHPNYLAEILFWVNVLGAGLPAVWANRTHGLWPGTVLPAACGGLGTLGIVQIMLMATKRLEGKQEEAYGGQDAFDEWKSNTSALFPTKVGNFFNAVLTLVATAGLAELARNLAALALFGRAFPLADWLTNWISVAWAMVVHGWCRTS